MTFYLLEVKLLRFKCQYVFAIGAKMSRDKEMPNSSLTGNESVIDKRQNLLNSSNCQSSVGLTFSNWKKRDGQIEILQNCYSNGDIFHILLFICNGRYFEE